MPKFYLKKEFIDTLRKEYKDCEIAELFKTDKTTISHVLNCKRQVPKSLIYKICSEFNVFPSEFLKKKND